MSQATSQYGNMFIEGMLAGQKSKQLDVDLQTSEIQRKLLELNMAHTQIMNPLLQAHQQAQTRREQLAAENQQLATQLAKETYGDAVSESKSRAGKAATDLEESQARLGDFKAGATSRDQERKAGALQAQTKALSEGLENLGSMNWDFSPYEIKMLTDPQLDQLGVEKAPATRAYWYGQSEGILRAKQQKFRDNNQVLQAAIQEHQDRSAAARGQLIDSQIRSGTMLGDLASQAPEWYGRIRPGLAKLYGEEVLGPADAQVESVRRRGQSSGESTTETTNPVFESEMQKSLAKLFTETLDLRDKAEEKVTEAENGTYIIRSKSKAVAEAQAQVDKYNKKLEKIQAQARPVKKTNVKNPQGITNDTSWMKVPEDATSELATKVKSLIGDLPKRKLKDSEIDQWVAALKAKGLKSVTRDQLKKVFPQE